MTPSDRCVIVCSVETTNTQKAGEMSIRDAANRVKNWTGTVHYADGGKPACGPVKTHASWLEPTIETVTCERCIAKFGEDADS